MKEEIEQILMNNFTRGDIKTATEQLDKLFGGKFTEEWLAACTIKAKLLLFTISHNCKCLCSYPIWDCGANKKYIIIN